MGRGDSSLKEEDEVTACQVSRGGPGLREDTEGSMLVEPHEARHSLEGGAGDSLRPGWSEEGAKICFCRHRNLCSALTSQPAPHSSSVQLWRKWLRSPLWASRCACSASGQPVPCFCTAHVRGLPVSYLTLREFPLTSSSFHYLTSSFLRNEIAFLEFGGICFLYEPLLIGLNIFLFLQSFLDS